MTSSCPSCANAVDASHNFCPTCGQQMSGLAPQHAPAASDEAELRLLTVMFCDLVGSTSLAERVEPEGYRALFQQYYALCDDAIRSHGGHVVKHIGDGVMAYFGYPVASGDDAAGAVLAGLKICSGAAEMFGAADHTATLDVRVGINTGSAIVGLAGTGTTREALSVGDTVNIAARVEGAAPPGRVAVTETTRRLVQDRFEVTALGPQPLKGVSEPIELFLVDGELARSHRQLERTAMVGRNEEMERLAAIAHEVRAGNAHFVVVSGEAGVGKSRFVDAARDQLGLRTAVIACSRTERHSNLRPIAQLIRQLGGDADPDARHDSRSSGAPQDDRSTAEYTPQARRARLFELARSAIRDAAREDALLVAIEDIHWADPSTLEFLGWMATSPTEARVLVLVTTRPGLQELPPGFEPLDLGPLSQEQAQQLIAALGEVEPQLTRAIIERADGVPLFVEELVRSAVQGSAIEDGVPITLHSLLGAQLDRVGRARRVAQLGALLGAQFFVDDVAELVDDPEALAEDIRTLVDADLLRVVDATTVRFRHALMQDAASKTMVTSVKRREHARIARAFERRTPERAVAPQTTARHWTDAGHDDRALPYYLEAAATAARDFANRESLALYERALQGLDRLVAEDPDRFSGDLCDVQERCGDIHALLHRLDEAESAYRLALASSTDPVRRSQLFTKLALVHQQSEPLAIAALDEAERSLATTPWDRPDRREAELRLRLAQLRVRYWFGDGEAMHRIIGDVEGLIEGHASPAQKVEFYDQCVLANFRSERYAMSAATRELGARYVDAARLSGDKSLLAEARFTNAFILLFGGQPDVAIGELEDALGLARRTGNRAIEVRTTIYRVTAQRLSGRADAEFVQRCEGSLELARHEQMPEYEAVALANLAWLAWHAGDTAGSAELADTALALWEQTGMAWPFRWLALFPRLAVAVHAADEVAIRSALDALSHHSQQQLPEQVALAVGEAARASSGPGGHLVAVAGRLVDVARDVGLFGDPTTDVVPARDIRPRSPIPSTG